MISNKDIPVSLREKFWLVSADMGYGHQRAVYPLRYISRGGIVLNVNSMPGAAEKERRLWAMLKRSYEFVSRGVNISIAGWFFSRLLDYLLYIPRYYPDRLRTEATFQVRYLKKCLKKGLCNSLLERIQKPGCPLVTSFYAPAIAAESTGHNSVYCIICDTDVNRVWATANPGMSRIIYFTPGTISARRLLSYGVPEQNIMVTGFPLPLELLGDRSLNILKRNLQERLKNLDPKDTFHTFYKYPVSRYLKSDWDRSCHSGNTGRTPRPVTITFAVGGAGAQKQTGRLLAKSFAEKINAGQVILNLSAGTRKELRTFFNEVKNEYTGTSNGIRVIYAENNEQYFDLFNECLHSTDILWTKPSELSFYCALGLPVIMTPAIGPQERCNQRWLLETGAGFRQCKTTNFEPWITELLESGKMAEAAFNGFLKARKCGTYNILDFFEKGSFVSSNDPLLR